MKFLKTPLESAYVIETTPFQDERGLFMRTFCKKEFDEIGHHEEFVQMNHSINNQKGTIRGMHFQKSPFLDTKLVRCIRGAIFDVIIDIRVGSTTFLQWFGVNLSAENKKMIYIPKGFAHGFQTLEDDTELLYHHTEFYTPKAEDGLRFDDKKLGIAWQLPPKSISQKDLSYIFIDDYFMGIKL
jgi:dTDP-4-dehydrorhamnose 3,5-epimerase